MVNCAWRSKVRTISATVTPVGPAPMMMIFIKPLPFVGARYLACASMIVPLLDQLQLRFRHADACRVYGRYAQSLALLLNVPADEHCSPVRIWLNGEGGSKDSFQTLSEQLDDVRAAKDGWRNAQHGENPRSGHIHTDGDGC